MILAGMTVQRRLDPTNAREGGELGKLLLTQQLPATLEPQNRLGTTSIVCRLIEKYLPRESQMGRLEIRVRWFKMRPRVGDTHEAEGTQ